MAAVAEVAETVAPAQLPVQARLMPVHPALLLPGALSFRPLRPLRPKPPLQGHVAHRPQTIALADRAIHLGGNADVEVSPDGAPTSGTLVDNVRLLKRDG